MKTTFFKVDRDIQNHWLWNDKPFSRGQAWIDLLLLATHTDHKGLLDGKIISRKRGEVHVSIVFLAERWGWSRNKVYRYLDLLKSEKMVTTNGTTDGTIITIEKYAFYQGDYTRDGTTNGTTDGTALGTRTEQQTEQGRNTNNKEKKDKECIRRDKNGLIKGTLQVRTDHSDILNNPLLCDEAKEKWINIREKAFAYQNRKKVNQ